MAKTDRTGNRKKRSAFGTRRPELGYYLIVTDTEQTEENYLMGLKQALPDDLRNKIEIKVVRCDTKELVNTCLKLTRGEAQYREPWIVFDRDRVPNFDKIIEKAENNKIHVGWSNPCIETWFDAYFGEMPNYPESTVCCQKFAELYKRKTGREYSKADKDIYALLNRYGDEQKAIEIAEKRYQKHVKDGNTVPSEMCPCTALHRLIDEIGQKVTDHSSN